MIATETAAPEFVSFHADRPAGADAVHPNANLESSGYMAMLDLLFRSARLFHRGARCTLLTDPATRVHDIRGRLLRVDRPIEHARLMLSRSLAQLHRVEQADFSRPLVLVDSDILFRASLQRLFAEDFDVALTWRENPEQPINGGLIVLGNRRPDAARAFFRRFVAIYRERWATDGNATWYGDQLALRDCVGLDHRAMAQRQLHVVDGVRIRLLPCDTYNFSPEPTFAAIASGLPDKVVLHFKGQRKRLMAPFWEAFLLPAESRWPWQRRAGRRALQQIERAAAAELTADPAAAPGAPVP